MRYTQEEWGETSFSTERNWYGHLPAEEFSDYKSDYRKHRDRALEDPSYDLFSHFMPTGRPKHDIGRYVMRHGINVPLLTSLESWQAAFYEGNAMLRSEHRQDYEGYSGLFASSRLYAHDIYPLNDRGYDPLEFRGLSGLDAENAHLRERVGPPLRRIEFQDAEGVIDRLGDNALTSAIRTSIINGLRDATADPSEVMKLLVWAQQRQHRLEYTDESRTPSPAVRELLASRWRFIPGVNIRMLKDPVIEGKYFIGGREAHHHWEINQQTAPDRLSAHNKGVYRGYSAPGKPDYELPTQALIKLYEKVRQLPYFDTQQAPVLELQYGDDGKLYFLQYLKTGLVVDDPGEFELPSGNNVVTAYDVRGATGKTGEALRLYLDPKAFTGRMEDQAFWAEFDLSMSESRLQHASMHSRVAILDYFLGFKNNHYGSAPLTRAPVAIGLEDRHHEALGKINDIARGRSSRTNRKKVDYIDTIITSNGRAATIESDWIVKTEDIN
jgi:hypothetical protein